MPVDESVEEILRPTWPDLPMPVTMTRPRHFLMSSTAAKSAVRAAADCGRAERSRPLLRLRASAGRNSIKEWPSPGFGFLVILMWPWGPELAVHSFRGGIADKPWPPQTENPAAASGGPVHWARTCPRSFRAGSWPLSPGCISLLLRHFAEMRQRFSAVAMMGYTVPVWLWPAGEADASRRAGCARVLPKHLAQLEAEAIYVLRETAAEFEKPVMLYSIGKDSSVLLHLALKAFSPARPPFPLLHVDTTWKFREMIAFRDATCDAARPGADRARQPRTACARHQSVRLRLRRCTPR